MIIDFLISKDGLRIDRVDVSMDGVRMGRGPGGLVAKGADSLTGAVHLALADLSAALARPEIVDQLLGGVSGIARPEIALMNGEEENSVRVVGSVETMGVRIPIRASTRVSISNNRLVLAATQVEGLPILRTLPLQLFDIVLPLSLPAGLTFTGVSTAPGQVIITFEGKDVQFAPPRAD